MNVFRRPEEQTVFAPRKGKILISYCLSSPFDDILDIPGVCVFMWFLNRIPNSFEVSIVPKKNSRSPSSEHLSIVSFVSLQFYSHSQDHV